MTDPVATLRPMLESDLEQVRGWRNHPAVRQSMYTSHEIGAQEHAGWFERARGDPRRHLLIFESDGVPRGFVSFTATGAGAVADWGFYAAPNAPRGTGRALGRAALAHGFERLGLHKIRGEVIEGNEASMRFHRALGFREEGVLREQHFDGARRLDVVCFGLQEREWRAADAPAAATPAPALHIAGRRIGAGAPPYVIAELSANHNGRLDTALAIVEAAKAAGADAVKLQTYRPDTITLQSDAEPFRIRGGLWDGRTLYDLYQEAHMPWEWHAPLFARARALGITIFSSPFDATAVDLLEDLGAPAYKIASFEAVDLPLIRYVARTRKPIIISTGMADRTEIAEAIQAARDGGATEIAILHCVSGYPAPAEDYNLRTLPDLAERFGVTVGLSDHTLDNATAIASVALGAAIVEKHFTLDRSGGGPDDSFSLEPRELAALCSDVRTAWTSLGRIDYGRKSSEQGNAQFRRSLYFVRAMKAGDRITADAVRSVRPGFGLPPKHLDAVIGRRLARDVEAATPVAWDALAPE